MPHIRFRTNLGSTDATAINRKTGADLKFAECQAGTEHDVNKEAADMLIDRGIAEPATESVRGVARQSDITAPAPTSTRNK